MLGGRWGEDETEQLTVIWSMKCDAKNANKNAETLNLFSNMMSLIDPMSDAAHL